MIFVLINISILRRKKELVISFSIWKSFFQFNNFFFISYPWQLLFLCQYNLIGVLFKKAYAMYDTVITHNGHFRTQGNCRKHKPQASVFFVSRVSSKVPNVLSQCNTHFGLVYLLFDIDFIVLPKLYKMRLLNSFRFFFVFFICYINLILKIFCCFAETSIIIFQKKLIKVSLHL